MVVSNVVYFHPYLGKWSNLTNFCQRGWNNQLGSYFMKSPWNIPTSVPTGHENKLSCIRVSETSRFRRGMFPYFMNTNRASQLQRVMLQSDSTGNSWTNDEGSWFWGLNFFEVEVCSITVVLVFYQLAVHNCCTTRRIRLLDMDWAWLFFKVAWTCCLKALYIGTWNMLKTNRDTDMQEFCVCIKKRTRTKGTSDWEWLAIWTLYALLGQGRYLTTATLIDSLCPVDNWHSNTTWTWDVWKTFFVDPGRCELVSWGAPREPGRLTTIIIIYFIQKSTI